MHIIHFCPVFPPNLVWRFAAVVSRTQLWLFGVLSQCPVLSSLCVQSVRYTACTQLEHGFVLLEPLIRAAIVCFCVSVCAFVQSSTCTRGCIGAPRPKTLVLQSSGRSLPACRARLQSLRGAQKVSTCADWEYDCVAVCGGGNCVWLPSLSSYWYICGCCLWKRISRLPMACAPSSAKEWRSSGCLCVCICVGVYLYLYLHLCLCLCLYLCVACPAACGMRPHCQGDQDHPTPCPQCLGKLFLPNFYHYHDRKG